jgi:hypothetical protein|tara:strand:- start:30 stop:386 length:357 start_codon:yes stop_codon:yes gene_type:complete
MSIKLALLKSGETVIADIEAKVDHNDQVVSLVFKNPFCVELITQSVDFDIEDESNEQEYAVRFWDWMPMTEDTDIKVNPDWIVSFTNPVEMLKNSYLEKMEDPEEDETIVDNFEVLNG